MSDRMTPALTRDLTLAYRASLGVATVMTVTSAAGLVFGTAGLYGPVTKLLPAFLGQDLLNLVVGVPVLLATMWLARRGSLAGLLLWPGALFYVVYDYAFYALGAPVNILFLPYLLLVTVSAYTLAAIVLSIDADAVRMALGGSVPARAAAAFLIALASLFTALWSYFIVATALGAPADPLARIVYTLDLTIQLPALFAGGVLLWRRRPLGYVVVSGLLLQAGAYLLGLSAICLLGVDAMGQPVTPAAWAPGVVVGATAIVLIGAVVRATAVRPVAVANGASQPTWARPAGSPGHRDLRP